MVSHFNEHDTHKIHISIQTLNFWHLTMKQNMPKKLSIATAIFVVATLVQTMVAQEIHVVGDNMGWIVPPLGSIAYRTWAATNTFIIGDILGTIYTCYIYIQSITLD